MKIKLHIIIRADASPTMGTGHVMRCLALAQWAKNLGIACTLMGRVQVPWVEERLAKEGIDFFPLLGEIPSEESADELIQSLSAAPQNSWIVLDGYHFTLECQKAVRAAGHKLLVIDDYAHLPEYSCDILLNQNIGAEDLVYKGDIGQKCLGLDYVLLRQEFLEAREKAQNRICPKTAQNILITLGGGSFPIHLQRIAKLLSIPEMNGRNLRIIAGTMDGEIIKNSFKSCPANIEILHNIHNMPALFLDTDLCISAGGSTCWELCCLGVPFAVTSLATNQDDIVKYLVTRNIAINLDAMTVSFMQKILQGSYLQYKIGGQELVDAKGGQRVLKALQSCTLKSQISLRNALLHDANFLLEVVNDPEVRSMSFQEHTISIDEHMTWFKGQLKARLPFYIAVCKDTPCGYVRFNTQQSSAIISIALHKEFRGQGLSEKIITMACIKFFNECPADIICAHVKNKNLASIKMFKKVGFLEVSPNDSTNTTLELKR